MKKYEPTSVSEQFKKAKPVILILLIIIMVIGVFIGITYYKNRSLISAQKSAPIDITHHKSEMTKLITLMNTDQFKNAGITKVWTEGEDNHILKAYVNYKWYITNHEDKEKLLNKLYTIWDANAGKINSAARIEFFDQKSGKKVAYTGTWGIKIEN